MNRGLGREGVVDSFDLDSIGGDRETTQDEEMGFRQSVSFRHLWRTP